VATAHRRSPKPFASTWSLPGGRCSPAWTSRTIPGPTTVCSPPAARRTRGARRPWRRCCRHGDVGERLDDVRVVLISPGQVAALPNSQTPTSSCSSQTRTPPVPSRLPRLGRGPAHDRPLVSFHTGRAPSCTIHGPSRAPPDGSDRRPRARQRIRPTRSLSVESAVTPRLEVGCGLAHNAAAAVGDYAGLTTGCSWTP
jgi:hypothetical protein